MHIKVKVKVELSAGEAERLACLAQRGHASDSSNAPSGHIATVPARRSTKEYDDDAAFLEEVFELQRKARAAFEAAS